jgi:hypothetical protein
VSSELQPACVPSGSCFMLVSCLAYSVTLKGFHVPPKHQLIMNRLHGVVSPKIDLLFVT